MRIPIRDMIGLVGAARRGTRVVDQIQEALDRHDLITDPDFAVGWIDTIVELRPASTGPTRSTAVDEPGTTEAPSHSEVALTVSSLKSASSGVTTIERTQDLVLARAVMLRHDFSQLAVMSGPRQLVGAVSWQSMAIAALGSREFDLAAATVRATLVNPDDDLIRLIPTIVEESFVFVMARDRTLGGIITTADLSEQFAALAKPFLLIGEIERRLRRVLSRRFEPGELKDAIDPKDSSRMIASAHDLTLGEIGRFIENEAQWRRLEWPVDRLEFMRAFDEVKRIRNDVMHFSPDPLSEQEEDAIYNFANWLRIMERMDGLQG